MTEWRWFLVCAAGGAIAAVLLYWLTLQLGVLPQHHGGAWIVPAPTPAPNPQIT